MEVARFYVVLNTEDLEEVESIDLINEPFEAVIATILEDHIGECAVIPTDILDPRSIKKLERELEEEAKKAEMKLYYLNMAYALRFILGDEDMMLGLKREDYVTFEEEER